MLNLSGKNALPCILQAEAAECGLACMAMVASFYGYHSDLRSLRTQYGSSVRGSNLQSLMDLAEQLELTPRALKVEMEDLPDVSLPAILHWSFNHFVVLRSVTRNSIVIHDPAIGIRKYSTVEAGKKLTGIVLELSPRSEFEAGQSKTELKLWDFWRGSKGLISSLIQILALSLLIQVFALSTPFYMQLVVDEVLVKHDNDLLIVLGVGFAGLTLISVLTRALRGYSMVYLTSQLGLNMGNSVMHHIIRLPLEYFQKRHLGDVISRFESVKPIQSFIAGASVSVIIDGLLALTTLAMIFAYSPLLTLVVIISVVLYGFFRMIQFQPLKNSNHENITANARLDSMFIESIRSLQGIKLSNKESQREARWRHQFVETINTGARVGRLTVVYGTANDLLTGMEYVLVIFLGAREVLNGHLTIGMLYAFMAFRTQFSNAVTSIIDQTMQYKMIGLHLERLSDITLSEQEEGLKDQGLFSIPISGHLEIRNISFSYAGCKKAVFENVSISIPATSFVALFGPSGVGKSTLLKIMMGLVTPTEGEIHVDEHPIEKLGLRSYRQAISAVTQEDSLFSGSLKDNITFFDISPDIERIMVVAKLAEIHDDILEMPMGYESLIGDMGMAMSQGQQQRLLIARALYSQPKILFLDEGTAHLDSQTEGKIMDNLKSLNITCVFVTHNPNLLPYSDFSLFLSDGICSQVRPPSILKPIGG
ncbi:MAG: peptidase domain-containing ABC transporter [Oceanicoccus sp.]